MAWNEPGGGNKDPWGNRGNNNDGPPDLDEALKKLQEKLRGIFGGGSGKNNAGKGGGFGFLLVGVIVVAALIYGFSGFYQVDAKERAVVLRFGAFNQITNAGLHWSAPLITEVFKENVTEERQYASKALMLTEDESIVELPITVQYNIGNVKDYVLNVRSPEISLRHASDSALRHVVGSSDLEEVLSGGRAKIAKEVKTRLQRYLDNYGTGIAIRSVNIQEARPPEEVRDAFDDVIKAKEDEDRLKNEAQAYANSVIPDARGDAQRMVEEAQAYKTEVTTRAEGESARFTKLLAEYRKAPKVTRERLYLESMETVLGNSSKVMVDVDGGNNMLYLPLDKMLNTSAQSTGGNAIKAQQLGKFNGQIPRTSGRSNNNHGGTR